MKRKILLTLCLLFLFFVGNKIVAQNIDVSTYLPVRIYNDVMGINSNISQINKFGRNISVNMTQRTDIWDGGAATSGNQIYTYEGFLTEASTIRLVSSSGLDSIGAIGARSLHIFGLDTDWLEQDENIILTGSDTVITTNTYLRLFRMKVISSGTSGGNEGIITAHAAGTVRMAQIDTLNNQTLMAIYTIPGNMTGYLTSHYGGMNNKKQATCVPMYLFVRPPGQVFQVTSLLGLMSLGGSYYNHIYTSPLRLDSKTDIKMRTGLSTANGIDVSAGFDIILVKK